MSNWIRLIPWIATFERDALVLRDDHPSIGDGDLTVDGASTGVNLLIGIEDP